ncbi:MAG: GtrA family protein [Clostridiales bacterium]|nr:GtrA family protein [Clostridiales bacterium]
MVQKIKDYLKTHPKQWELLRYLFAGGLTTLLSMVIHYGVCFLLAEKDAFAGGNLIAWILDGINRATPVQMSIASGISWVISVLFAFWINRVMVFRVEKAGAGQIIKELVQFAGSRIVSFLVFEQGMMLLLKAIGVSNIVNRVIVLVFVMVFNYVASKFWIFKQKPSDEVKDTVQEE